jgi:hypothetical protein
MPSTNLPPDLPPAPERLAAPAPIAVARAAVAPAALATAALATAALAELPELRLVVVPDAAPPYDCDTHGAVCPARRDVYGADSRGNGQLPAPEDSAPPDGSASAVRSAPPDGSASPDGSAARAASATRAASVTRAGSATRKDSAAVGGAAAWPGHFAQVVVEILAGARSTRQIIPCTTDRVRAQVGHLVPLLASDQRPRIQRIVTSCPAARIVEMTVVVSFGPRSRALAIRCEHVPARPATPGLPPRPARWLCTELVAV